MWSGFPSPAPHVATGLAQKVESAVQLLAAAMEAMLRDQAAAAPGATVTLRATPASTQSVWTAGCLGRSWRPNPGTSP